MVAVVLVVRAIAAPEAAVASRVSPLQRPQRQVDSREEVFVGMEQD